MKPSTTFAFVAVCGHVAGCWMIFSASAQRLAKLNAQAISNRIVGVSWPYANAGFVLQESSLDRLDEQCDERKYQGRSIDPGRRQDSGLAV
jgi:hypothetical protein